MKYGQIAESRKINEMIYFCFQYISDIEARKFVLKFKNQPHESLQIMHTFHELILGAFLSKNGHTVKSEYKINSKTPDWCIFNGNSQPQCIIELVNFHPDIDTSSEISRQIKEKGIWCNFKTPNTDRLYQTIWGKSATYKSIVNQFNLSYIVCVFGDFFAIIDQEELNECIFDTKIGIFELYPEVSGLLYFEESSGSYFFTYKPNPNAHRSMYVPSGQFH